MVVVNNFYFLQNETAATVSPVTKNMTGENLTIQVDGDGAGFTLKLFGCSDMASNEYYELTGLSTTFETLQEIKTNGIYSFGIDGIAKMKLQLTAITSGSVTAFGKITKGV